MRKHWLLTLLPLVCAGGTGPRNWGVPKILRQSASASERQACGEAGSFFVEVAGKTLCSSSKTREAPQSADCPIGWSTHKTTGSCLPPSEVSEADCGEGYNWIGNGKSCAPFTGQGQKGCREGQWYHSRSMSCIDNSWSTRPPSGQCDNGKSCPEGWFWHAQLRQCRPEKKRSPKPNCKDWNDKEQCCGGHHPPKPSAGVGHGGGGGSGGGHGGHKGQGDRGNNKGGNGGFGHGSSGHKRDSPIKRDQDPLGTTFKQSDLDKLYCPKNLHACSITTTGGEWAYECIDFATELESCGGCASMGEGQDCTAIPYAKSVECEAGLCAVYSCKAGLRSNGTACV